MCKIAAIGAVARNQNRRRRACESWDLKIKPASRACVSNLPEISDLFGLGKFISQKEEVMRAFWIGPTIGVGLTLFVYTSVKAQDQSCGDQGVDNRPNICRVLINNTWVTRASKCTKISEGKFRYTHCSGATKAYDWPSGCCVASTSCPGATYIAECLGLR